MNADGSNAKPLEYQTKEGQLNILGFWIFLAAEIVLFSTLFATYAVLFNRTADAPPPAELFEPGTVLVMTFILLTSSFTCGIAIHGMRRGSVKGLMTWLIITLILGLSFLGFEIYEFVHYAGEGATLQSSAFWSAFYILAGTHGVHVTLGIGWATLLLVQLAQRGITSVTSRKVFIIGLYWHFLDVIWIFIFTGVYLIGMVV
ncbi:cytochrome aa3 quinol oxidase subunit 3 [Lentibacillus halodurans]|uniref:Quinol oxidase subunit 3 n=1 Tax=Lentibacillus halodurans TaxID=237679 RepID=A0A1I0Z9Q9_9BACI|nr:cytochrome aa3 quinol oxidase subunit III [Lentibacillus halodurans]SFB22077.1 cytochrome aa3 quinol oxidase subunit 3 [Lentibacillus halodurans]